MRTRTLFAPALAAAALAVAAAPAGAHVTIQEPEHAPGAYTVLTFQNGHGCEGSPTTQVEIQVPEQILDVTPSRHPFYDVSVTTEPLDEVAEGPHGEQITERESVITYTATDPLLDGYRDAFEVSMRIPEAVAGETLYFPVVQTCAEGETAWIEIPADGESGEDLESPAPSIRVTDEVVDGHGAGSDGEAAAGSGAATDGDAGTGDDGAELASSTTSSDDGTDPLTIVALVVAALGLIVGAAGFAASRKATR